MLQSPSLPPQLLNLSYGAITLTQHLLAGNHRVKRERGKGIIVVDLVNVGSRGDKLQTMP
jgi:hypothetical protein